MINKRTLQLFSLGISVLSLALFSNIKYLEKNRDNLTVYNDGGFLLTEYDISSFGINGIEPKDYPSSYYFDRNGDGKIDFISFCENTNSIIKRLNFDSYEKRIYITEGPIIIKSIERTNSSDLKEFLKADKRLNAALKKAKTTCPSGTNNDSIYFGREDYCRIFN